MDKWMCVRVCMCMWLFLGEIDLRVCVCVCVCVCVWVGGCVGVCVFSERAFSYLVNTRPNLSDETLNLGPESIASVVPVRKTKHLLFSIGMFWKECV